MQSRPYDRWMILGAPTVPPLAHAGEAHWYDTLMFAAPMIVIAAVLWWTGRQERREREAAERLEPKQPLDSPGVDLRKAETETQDAAEPPAA